MVFGFIGAGNMGSALCTAVSKKEDIEILVSNRTVAKAEALAEKTGAKVSTNEEIAATANWIFLGVKPQMMAECLEPLKDVFARRRDTFVLVTMAAGLKMEKIRELAGVCAKVIRIMPNTPASIGEGVILMCKTDDVVPGEAEYFKNALSEAGIIDEIPEKLIDAGSAVSGCGPAFVYMFIEALADGAVKCGIPRDKAIKYAAQTLKGSAELVLTSGKHPEQLKDEVCSPGGSTIAGVHALEEGSFRGTAINAVEAAYNRTVELGK